MPGIVCDGLFERILRSCSEELEKCADVAVNDEALQSVCATLQLEEVKEVGSSVLRLPLQFDDTASEVNFLAILHLLSFGSGYEPLLQDMCKIGSQECMQFGTLGMYISGNKLDVEFLERFSDLQVNNFFRIPTHEDVPSEMHPAIQISRPGERREHFACTACIALARACQVKKLCGAGPLMPLARSIREQLQDAAQRSREKGFGSVGECVMSILNDAATAGEAVEALGETYPGFKDCDAAGACFYSKAQALVAGLIQRFAGEDRDCFDFPVWIHGAICYL
mmetsp:Transcript_30388/g.85857  ORF Transcript_30388/g.85857 Transcript_30388/m.85857 type:complete len:281 (-) Transcript_30388:1072-1914(-)